VLGIGAVGRALARALVGGGLVRSLRVWARVEDSAVEFRDELREVCGTRAGRRLEVRALGDLSDSCSGADLVLFCVVDDSIGELATRVAALEPAVDADAVALHLSGFASTDVFEPLGEIGFSTGCLHPLISLTNGVRPGGQGQSPFAGAHFALGGDERARARAHELATALGGVPFELAQHESARALYHGAASLLAGGVVATFDAAERMLAGAVGGDGTVARAALMGLLESTVRNLKVGQAQDVLTGPVHRGDSATVAGHLAALADLGMDGAESGALVRTEELYRELSLAMLELVRRRGGTDSETLDQLAVLLSSGPENV